ncbi:NADP-dependent malic enzyme-like [Corylus avellana]|uniref:NADP-dependent malic enzyme-like n=1 Tax=Corylus avellana TaxID=13451 RepID=UPI00286BDAC4|nr:NADP-dependent malic enzyme-like [Corylus avellana]
MLLVITDLTNHWDIPKIVEEGEGIILTLYPHEQTDPDYVYKKVLKDEFYIGLRHKRATGQEYAELLDEFLCAVKQNYGEKVLVQFEDFANHNAFELLARYRSTHLVFNDDIQGTASVVLAGIIAALKLVGGTLADNTFLFLGAGELRLKHHLPLESILLLFFILFVCLFFLHCSN